MNDQIKEKLLKAMEDKSLDDWAAVRVALSPEDAAEVAMQFINQPQWRDISTAPKDGSKIIVYRPIHDGNYIPKVGIDYWFKNRCWGKSRSDTQPTHWQPLPEPPKE